jgi:hypothetical protein
LWVVRRSFGNKPPTLQEYAASHKISADTIRRAARALVRPVLRVLRARRPGPRAEAKPADAAAMAACLACNDLLESLLPAPIVELASSASKRGLVAQTARHWHQRGVPLTKLADWLSVSAKTLHRWIRRLDDDGVPQKSRRPDTSPDRLPAEIQGALWSLRRALPELSIAELTRVFVRKFAALLASHGRTSVSAKTVGRYVGLDKKPDDKTAPAVASPRGGYEYPPPLAMAWIDTAFLEVAGVSVHIVAAMEASSRVVLAGEVFEQECAATTTVVLEQALTRVPELTAVLRDRGTPYLNSAVNEMLASRDVLPIDAHPYFPIDKAALERFWRWLKEWLCYALAPYQERCRHDGRILVAAEVVAVVQPVLRACLRAYNLLPQPYLEEQSPIERIDRLLRSDGDGDFSLGDLRRKALERETKDDLLEQVSKGLQLEGLSLARLRSDFARVSRAALRSALEAVGHKLFVARDPSIRVPYAYLRAVAKRKEDEHQRSHAYARRTAQEERERKAREAALNDELNREEQQREHHPEDALPEALDRWVSAMASPIHAVRSMFTRQLTRVLMNLRVKLGAAFAAQVDAIHDSMAALAERVCRAPRCLRPRALLSLRLAS